MGKIALPPSVFGISRWFTAKWGRQTLTRQFLFAGSFVLLGGMFMIGFWVTERIEQGVTRNTATSAALYMASFVAPLVQELAHTDRVTAKTQAKLDAILKDTDLGRKVVSFKIWKENGLIAYSSRPAIIGMTFPPTPNLRTAWKGQVAAEFDTLDDEEDAHERAAGRPLLEMYSPIREVGTGRVIAVAEFYEMAGVLKENLLWSNLQSWFVVATVTLTMLAALSGIVIRGSRTIEHQRSALENRVGDLSALLAQNEGLRSRLQRGSQRTAEINEHYLRRISADLHDGPAQLLALALLRLDSLKPLIKEAKSESADEVNLDAIHASLTEAIGEIREICTGLTLPHLDELSAKQVLRQVVTTHERRTGTQVVLNIESTPDTLPRSLKICVFRFVQEALQNAYRHADGIGQEVRCRFDGEKIEVAVSDKGRGFARAKTSQAEGLGLPGLRERVESLGGNVEIESAPASGTRLIMRCAVAQENWADAEQD